MASNPPFGGAMTGSGRSDFGQAAASSMSMQWSALHDAANLVCTLAGLAPENRKSEIRNFPAIMRDTGGWRHALAQQGVEDLAAIMEPGLGALLAVHARGISPGAAALALWQEFHSARSALMALVPPLGVKRRA
ncbi:hypothetical protein [Novosphingobium lentum]|uniref:hypothetical protein n=1 Tax=Novosphingobium lentum TaxID=145287 RepID=UPI000ADD9DD0|nr:hypothetical protein [Novosphingobium lentum]